MSAHAKLGASNAHRWLACPGSVSAEAGLTDRISPYADEGLAAHELAEICLSRGCDPFEWEGKRLVEYNAVTVTHEMCSAVQEYVDYVIALGGVQGYEWRVHYDNWVPGGFGTADAIAFDANTKTLHVVDFKYGQGVEVYAERNPQGMLYGLGAYEEYHAFADIEQVHIHIVQPRRDHISDWRISVPALCEWAQWVSERAQLALSHGAKRVPGESQCRFCKAAAMCPALRDYTHAVIGQDFDNLDADNLGPDQMREVLDAKPLIEKFLSAVEDHVKSELEQGREFPGYKLVAGRSMRAWSDEDKAKDLLVDHLGDKAYERNLLSPAKAEKALGKKGRTIISDLVIKPAGKPVLVPASDKRRPITISAQDFEQEG